jgi:uncharacterized protein
MDIAVFKKLIIESQEYIKDIHVQPRSVSFDAVGNYVVTGPRRCGKTFVLLNHLLSLIADKDTIENILYMSFEDERLLELQLKDMDSILQAYNELYSLKPIIFFDEIQNINGWEKFVRRLADKGNRVFVTGSNAKLLSKEIASTLGGRFLIKELAPLSFIEYLQFNGISLEKNYEYSQSEIIRIKKCFQQYFEFGGFPETLQFSHKKEYLSNLYQKVFHGDIITRYAIKNEFALRLLVKKIAESVTSEMSFNRLKNILVSTGVPVSTNTLIEYFEYLRDSYLVYSIPNFAHKFTEREGKRKFYFSDNGILSLFLTDQPQQLLENLVFNKLKNQFGENVYYYRKDYEVDFFTPDNKTLYQACYSMSNHETRRREIEGITKCCKHTKAKKGMIITFDETETIKQNNIEIAVVPVWKWLLAIK